MGLPQTIAAPAGPIGADLVRLGQVPLRCLIKCSTQMLRADQMDADIRWWHQHQKKTGAHQHGPGVPKQRK